MLAILLPGQFMGLEIRPVECRNNDSIGSAHVRSRTSFLTKGRLAIRQSMGSLFLKQSYWAGVAFVFGWAIWLRFRAPLIPIASDPDCWGFLSPAIGKLIGTGFVHRLRNYLYPGWLYLLLRCFHDFRAITVAQHMVGLASGAIFLLIWQSLRRLTTPAILPARIHALVGLLPAAIYLTAQDPIRFETDVRPEGIVSFLILLNLYVVIEFTYGWLVANQRGIPVLLGMAAVATSTLVSLAKPSFTIAAIGALSTVVMSFFCRCPRPQKWKLGLGSVLILTALLLPEHLLARGDIDSKMELPTHCFIIHANLIRDQMAVDLKSRAVIPYQRDWVSRVHDSLAAEIIKSAQGKKYPKLGFDPDYLMFKDTSINMEMRAEFHGDIDRLSAFYYYYYLRVWRYAPDRMLAKIIGQMGVFYSLSCPAYQWPKYRDLPQEYSYAAEFMRNHNVGARWAAYQPIAEFMNRTAVVATSVAIFRQPRFTRWLAFLLAKTYLVSLVIVLMLSVFSLCFRKMRRALGGIVAVILLLYWYTAANCFEVATIHCLEDPRYQHIQIVLTVLAEFSALLFLLAFGLQLRCRG
jgi:hypothetical protein